MLVNQPDAGSQWAGEDIGVLADETLVACLGQRDLQALEELYRRHARVVYSMAFKLLTEATAAEEVVQECFLKLWRQPERYQRDRGKLLPWLLGVAHHRAIDVLRRQRLERRHHVDRDTAVLDVGGGADLDTQVWGNMQAEAVGRALQRLPDSQRVALELAYLRGMTQSEIAVFLGEPLGTIKTRMRLALQKLRATPELVALVADAG
ncbi:MAG: sigma-70 family RNA polymerase sigma factor [Chloroflexi bacterium]|nr:sigma-70 family RNA polymerase sigma factor [Chloroflexota bacterium]